MNNARRAPLALLTPILCLIFAITVITMMQDFLWVDESWSLWAVHPPTFGGMLARISHDYHPPLYFVLLDAWVALTGQSLLAVRVLSSFFALMAAAGTFALARHLFDWQTGVIALLLIGCSGMLRYYGGETRMYALLLLLSVLCTMQYRRWLSQPTLARSLLYGLLLASLVYTHYHGGWLVLAHVADLLLFQRQRLRAWVLPLSIAALLFVPWLPVLAQQIQQRPALLIAAAAPVNLGTVGWITGYLSTGAGVLLLLPPLLRPDWQRGRHHRRALIFAALWLILPPAAMLALNAAGMAVFYHVRYLIGTLPAGALLAGFAIRNSRLRALSLALLMGILVLQLAQYRQWWPMRGTAYDRVLHSFVSQWQEGDALLLDLDETNMTAYFARQQQVDLRRYAALDFTTGPADPATVRRQIDALPPADTVWLIMPGNTARTWQVAAQISASHHADSSGALENMLFVRFVPGGAPLRFQFGPLLRLETPLPADYEVRVAQGDPLCLDLTLRVLRPLDDRASLAVHLVDAANQSQAQWDSGLGVHPRGEILHLTPCIPASEALPAGDYGVQLSVYDWQTLVRQPVLETSSGDPTAWGDVLLFAMLRVE
jgi:hypothetical protein